VSKRINVMIDEDTWGFLGRVPAGERSRAINEALRAWAARRRRSDAVREMEALRTQLRIHGRSPRQSVPGQSRFDTIARQRISNSGYGDGFRNGRADKLLGGAAATANRHSPCVGCHSIGCVEAFSKRKLDHRYNWSSRRHLLGDRPQHLVGGPVRDGPFGCGLRNRRWAGHATARTVCCFLAGIARVRSATGACCSRTLC
jgi:hypothetical protein